MSLDRGQIRLEKLISWRTAYFNCQALSGLRSQSQNVTAQNKNHTPVAPLVGVTAGTVILKALEMSSYLQIPLLVAVRSTGTA
jgi:hypothetical protein